MYIELSVRYLFFGKVFRNFAVRLNFCAVHFTLVDWFITAEFIPIGLHEEVLRMNVQLSATNSATTYASLFMVVMPGPGEFQFWYLNQEDGNRITFILPGLWFCLKEYCICKGVGSFCALYCVNVHKSTRISIQFNAKWVAVYWGSVCHCTVIFTCQELCSVRRHGIL